MGRFQLGQTKPGGSGRTRGTPNKKTVDFHGSLESHGLDIVGQLAELLPQLAADKRADVLIDLMSYLYPKRKAIEQKLEIETKPGTPPVETPEERVARKARVDELLKMHRALDGCTCPSIER